MARKDLLKSVMQTPADNPTKESRSDYALKGASKSMKVSIDHLADSAKKMTEGETIVEIETALIDNSFVSDRLSGDDEAYMELKNSIEGGRQDTPVLLRPHPKAAGRYMIVFGHRRVRVATELGRRVRAVIKETDDVGHILAQGQENTARADLSFIEKALFAKRLRGMGQPKDVIQAALTVDATLLSRLLAVSRKVPIGIIEAIGPAKAVGRDRWEAFKKLIILPANKTKAEKILTSNEFCSLDSNGSLNFYINNLPRRMGLGARPKQNHPNRLGPPKMARSKVQWVELTSHLILRLHRQMHQISANLFPKILIIYTRNLNSLKKENQSDLAAKEKPPNHVVRELV